VSAEISLVAVDDRGIDGAADPSHADTAPASEARHEEREEKGEEPRGTEPSEEFCLDGHDSSGSDHAGLRQEAMESS
jgi:hypothetical protein